MVNYKLVFDEAIIKQLQRAGKNEHLKSIIKKFFNELEEKGPRAGKLLDSQLFIYEVKNKHPPLRLYFKHNLDENEIYVFEFQMKTSSENQQKIIDKIRFKLK